MRDQIVSVQNRIFREELDTRLSEIDRLQHSDFDRVGELAQEALIYAEQLGDFYGYTRAMAFFAWSQSNQNNLEDALTVGAEALQLARLHNFLELEGRIVNTLAVTFAKIGANEEAMSLFQHQLKLAMMIDMPEMVFGARHDLAIHLINMHRIDEAVELMELAMRDIPPELSESPGVSMTYTNVCKLFSQIGKPEKGMVYGERSLRIEQARRDPLGIARACIALAFNYADMNDYAQANLYIHQAVTLMEKDSPLHAETVRFDIEIIRAHMHMLRGQIAEASPYFERAYEISMAGNLLQQSIGMLETLKQIYTDIGDKDRLASVYRRLSEDVPRMQQRSSDMRLNILKLVFAADKAALKAEINLSQQKSAMMAHLAHEFRTPLDTIQDVSDRMAKSSDDLSPDERRSALQDITVQVNTMRTMLDNIIDLLQPDEYAIESHFREPITLLRLSEIILAEVKRYRVDGMRIVTHIQSYREEFNLPVRTIQTALSHLLTNALKFSRVEVEFSLAIDNGWLTAVVSDKGIGIPAEEQQAVFQPLYRAGNQKQAGHGLGLAIVKKQISSIGGTITLDSALYVGTTVTVSMPL